jgi:hypothetical protein
MPVKGGEAIRAKLTAIGDKMFEQAKSIDVGFLENSTPYADGTSTPTVAAIQEFGAPRAGIPPRPFFRTMVAEHKGEWGGQIGTLMKKNGLSGLVAMGQMGELISGELKDSIQAVVAPPLSETTLLLRERFGNNPQDIKFKDVQEARADAAMGATANVTGTQAKPLIWTGHLLNSVAYKVNS